MNADQSIEESSRIVEIIEKTITVAYRGEPPEYVVSFFRTSFSNILRDLAHFLEFLILGILTILYSNRFKSTTLRRTLLVLLLCILISLIDETIQFFSPGRAFELYDLILDGLGSIIGGILVLLVWKIRKSSLKWNQ